MSPLLVLLAVVLATAVVVVARAGSGVAEEARRLRGAVRDLGELRPAVVDLRTRGQALGEAMERRSRT